ncbi:diguanylate cyclase [Massilia eurypsychrophila]|uniref:Diguanylate cyclase n=1 Tax=Massilia eurypsychrophila TaxID=1485217 RepID=A0A2G8TBC8_9BURK|nr:EAL domain-containing protein [Massilia eurypsychrophila]PIL43294.1 diguanylate cyclase [Massilia eurypsychrophila]
MDKLDNIAHWRGQIFSSLLTIVLALGTLTAIPSMIQLATEGLWPVVVMDVVALTWLSALWWFKKIPYTIRVLNFLAIIYVIGVGLMMTVGPVSQIYLFSVPLLAATLLGMRSAMLCLGVSALTIFVLSYAGLAKMHMAGMPENGLLPSLMITLNYLFIGAIITASCSILLQRLERSLEDLRMFARSLQRGKDELHTLNAELRLTAAAVARLNDMVVIAKVVKGGGAEQPIIFVNEAFERRTGYQRAEVIGNSWRMLRGADTDPAVIERIGAAVARTEPVTAELMYYTKSGAPYWVEMELVPFADEGGNNTHWVAVGRDITERKKSEGHIHRLAFFDVLTGLPNRRLLMERLDQLLASAQAGAGFGAVMFIDLDHFKYINDARGHAVGDALLRNAAERLSRLVRKGDTVARIGGDEFVVLLAHLGHDKAGASESALVVAEKIRHAITECFQIDGQSYNSSASIGVTLLPKAGQTVHDLLREADTAMYRAKAEGRNGFVFFEATMQAEVERRLTMERDLADAFDNGELAMHLQLQVDSRGVPVGAELLMRWRTADGAIVSPDLFIPVAEESGLIVPLGQWAMRQACHCWQKLSRAGHALPLSVNVSPSQFRQPDFVAQVREILADTGTPADQLIFEVTEGLLIEKLDETIARMHELAALGIRLSIDDFGTGYSSLSYLKRMPLYELKIDRSFIRDTPGDANGTAIVQSIIAMAGHLGLRVVAEGVETRAQAEFLAANGAPGMQGYLFARPMPLPNLIALLHAYPATLALQDLQDLRPVLEPV